jgi:hypothetical protein
LPISPNTAGRFHGRRTADSPQIRPEQPLFTFVNIDETQSGG